MTESTGNGEAWEDGSYQLQVYAQSPVLPTPRQLMAEAEGGGLGIQILETDATSEDAADWSLITLALADEEHGRPATIAICDAEAMGTQLAGFRQDRANGEEIPEAVFQAARLFVVHMEWAEEGEDDDEGSEAAFTLSTWALATLTEGLVFDPEEDIFADPDSFLALLMDGQTNDEPGLVSH